MADVNTFVEKTLELLNLEREAEISESKAFCESADNVALEKKGVCVRKLVVYGRKTGLYGRTLLTLGRGKSRHVNTDTPLPAHCITPGDIVGLGYSSGGDVSEFSSGIVTRVSSSCFVVAFDESLDSQSFDENALLRVTRLANDITHKRMKRALESLCNPTSLPCCHLIDVLFGAVPIGEPLNISHLRGQSENEASQRVLFFNEDLNQSQRTAVQFALTRRDVGVIHGPPGTGKTTTIVEVIVQAVKSYHLKVLACAPSNIAVDNIVERLAKHKIKAVRLGHPARVLEKIHSYSLDAILDSSDGTAIVKDVRRDIDMTQSKLKSCRGAGERSRFRTEIKFLRKELREREGKALKQILLNAEVILATNVSASQDGPLKHVPRDHFDLVIIDEAAQAIEAACWVPLQWGSRCILAGDHQQLPPTIMSRDAAKRGLETTLMERVIQLLGDPAVHMLTTQYRMNETIMKWASEQLYGGRLLADASVARHLLCDLEGVEKTELTSVPLLMIDTAGCDLYELETPEEASKGNEGESEVVVQHIETLVSSGVKHCDIGIITPYNLQVELLRSCLSTKYPALEIKSVDGFQGREKEAIVISLVRSNNRGEIGFLAENRRINVAVTRARRHLTVVGDSSTVSRDPFLNSLVNYVNKCGEVWSAEQYRCHEISGDSILPKIRGTQKVSGAKTKHQITTTNEGKGGNKKSGKNGDKNSVKNNDGDDETRKHKAREGWNWRDTRDNHGTTRDNRVHEEKHGITKDSEEKRKKLEEEIRSFLKDERRFDLEFQTDLTSEERFMVHCIAEESGLGHVSKGTGKERFIVLAKTTSPSDGTPDNDFLGNGTETITEDVEEKRKDEPAACPSCGKSIPSTNLVLHEVTCQRKRQQAQKDFPAKKTGADKKCSNEKGAKSSTAPKKDESDDNLDELLAEFKFKDSRCALPGCKKSILTVGQKCRCCVNTFCLGHRIPEVHGCSQAAKEHARCDARAKAAGNQKQPSSKSLAKRTHLQRKLENRLKDLEGNRKPKQEGKK